MNIGTSRMNRLTIAPSERTTRTLGTIPRTDVMASKKQPGCLFQNPRSNDLLHVTRSQQVHKAASLLACDVPILATHRARILLGHAEPIDPQCNAPSRPGVAVPARGAIIQNDTLPVKTGARADKQRFNCRW